MLEGMLEDILEGMLEGILEGMLEGMLEDILEGMLALFCMTKNCQEPHCQFIWTNAGRNGTNDSNTSADFHMTWPLHSALQTWSLLLGDAKSRSQWTKLLESTSSSA